MTFPQQPQQPVFSQPTAPPPPAQQFQQAPPAPVFQQPPANYAPQYAPQPQYVPQAPTPPVQQASSIADFWDQRNASEGRSISWTGKPIGTSVVFQQTRAITPGDIRHLTNQQNQPQFYNDGSPKWVLIIPGRTPDGEPVTYWCKGADKTALQAELAKHGLTEPEAGSIHQVTYVRDKPNGAGYQPTKIKDWNYTRPAGAAPVNVAPEVPVAPAPELTVTPSQTPLIPTPEVPQAPAQPAPQAPVQAAPPAAPAATPSGPVADPQALFASLLNE